MRSTATLHCNDRRRFGPDKGRCLDYRTVTIIRVFCTLLPICLCVSSSLPYRKARSATENTCGFASLFLNAFGRASLALPPRPLPSPGSCAEQALVGESCLVRLGRIPTPEQKMCRYSFDILNCCHASHVLTRKRARGRMLSTLFSLLLILLNVIGSTRQCVP